ncbi:MAG: SpoIVB peptidase S55 domain-containing protein [Verrucomicrobiota bacterium]
MTRIFLSILLGFAVLPARAVEMLRPDQLKSGMKGYGLSVFKGTKPERFEVEILGVLKNAMPKQDMILIRTSGMDLEKHKVIAGMSGSPIYIDGKLIGALAYGWSFENEPIAGVTPIHNMLAEFGKQPVAAPAAGNYGTPRPLLTPLALGGFSSATIEMFADKLAGFGFVPAATGGGGEAGRGTGRYEPGGAIGVQLIRGDLNATGVGTVTYVDGRRVLAFGHPMFHSGQILAPTCEAEVHTILSSLERSFKMASPIAELGALVGDWQSCIVADTQAKASMIPINVTAENRATGDNEIYKLEVIDNPMFSPLLAQMAVAEAVTAASGSSHDTTVHVTMEAQLIANNRERTVTVSDTYFNPNGGLLSRDLLQPVAAVFQSPFGNPQVKRITVKVVAEQTRQTAEIRRAYFSKAEVNRGERVLLNVVLKPYGKEEVTKTIAVEVPAATDSMKALALTVLSGNAAPPDLAPPDSLGDYLAALEKQHPATDLVVLLQTSSQGLPYRGKLLKKMPASVLGVLDDTNRAAPDIQQIVAPTDWVLTGQATVQVPIRQE